MKSVSVPGNTTIFTVTFQFLGEGVLFRKVTSFLTSHHEYGVRFASLETFRHKQESQYAISFYSEPTPLSVFPHLLANYLLMRDIIAPELVL